MKRLTVLIILLAMCFLSGCVFTTGVQPNIQIKADNELNPILEIAARRVGHQVALKDPAKVAYLIQKCDEILNPETAIDIAKPLLLQGLRYAATRYTGDPMLADDLVSLLKYFRMDFTSTDINIDVGEFRTLLAAVKAFREGLKV